MIRSIGFTGTRHTPSDRQLSALDSLLRQWKMDSKEVIEFHHGDCFGADAAAHRLAKSLFFRVLVHPPSNKIMRAFCDGDVILEPRAYVYRNQDIVEASDILVAMPLEPGERIHSGTWSTVRYARSIRKSIIILLPDGSNRSEPS